MKKLKILLITCFFISLGLASQEDTIQCAPKPMEIWDIMKWKTISDKVLCDDGKWFAWRTYSEESDGMVCIRNLEEDSLYEFGSGFGRSGQMEFSGNHFMFIMFPNKEEQDKLKKEKKSGKNSLGIVDLKTGKLKKLQNVKNFGKPEESSDWIGIQFCVPDSRENKDEFRGSDFMLYHLADSSFYNFGNVAEFQFDKTGKWLVLVIDAEDTALNCVLLRNMETGKVISVASGKADFSKLSWTREGDGCCFLKAEEKKDYREKSISIIGLYNLDKNDFKTVCYHPELDDRFPENMAISPHFTPAWKEELDGIFFGIHKNEMTEEAKAKQDSCREKDEKSHEDLPDMVIWHWQDKRLQSQQWVTETGDKNYSYLSYFHLKNNQFHQLANDSIRHYGTAKRGNFAIGYNQEKYKLQESLEGRSFRDLYVYDLTTGENHLALAKNRWYFGPSPDNRYFLYYEKGHFYTYDMKQRKSVNITASVPVSFINVEDDHNVTDPPYLPLDWSEDSKYVVLSDGWDLWKIDRNGDHFQNLTRQGRKDKIRFGNEYKIDPDDEGIDFSGDVFFRMHGELNKKMGLAEFKKGSPL
ncbi:MAG: hypothetical protein JXQ65_04220 [Candidatus Marinimicrobia bacterium]|nr:hypothetical protein [Candidatus Neomarinimicrobiota bacterium]